jgi:hypothetical protein
MDNDIPECQCDGAGHCPVYKTYMNQRRYEHCKNDLVWRKDYIKLYKMLNSSSFHERVQQRPEHKALVEAIEIELQKQTAVKEEERKACKEYKEQKLKKEIEYFKSLSSEEKEIYKKKRIEYLKRRKKAFAERQQLEQVVDNIKDAGVTSENYQENTEGLGDLISNVLSKLGVTEETVKKWSGTQEGCGCNKRKKFLNTILPFRKKE